ncbi:MAG: threonine synthase [Armatimonadota bacterium]|nr:threonine synthase [Armatimonadota bacterium]
MSWLGIIEEYRDHLPVGPQTPVVTLYEGNTPLVPVQSLSRELGIQVYVKFEGANPTGSFKDRGMTVAISKALEIEARGVVCASTGNTSASAAAYAARARIPAFVIVPSGAVATGKLGQAVAHGAVIIAIDGTFDQALSLAREAADRLPLTLVNSLNPYRLEGQKTAAFEICDVLGDAPDLFALPVGNAGNITAIWRGFVEYHRLGRIRKLPRMLGFQAQGASPIVEGRPIREPRTVATAIRIGNPASWQGAVKAIEESEGLIARVSDEEILEAQLRLAREEGLFVEPASAASVAGMLHLARNGVLPHGEVAVCLLTGHGLKDVEIVLSRFPTPVPVPPTLDAVAGAVREVIGG